MNNKEIKEVKKPVSIAFDDTLKKKIEKRAEKEGRSFGAQVRFILNQSL